jgi:hypothetical protein
MALTTVPAKLVGTLSATSDNQAFTSDTPIYENLQTITANYAITTGSNAMSAGPITIADGIVVTIPDGCTWTIV